AQRQDLAVGPRAHPEVPHVAGGEADAELGEGGAGLGAEPIDTVAGAAQHRREVAAAVVAHLPEGVESRPEVEGAPARPSAALELQEVAAGDVDVALLGVDVVAGEHRGAPASLVVGVEAGAGGDLLGPMAAPDSAAAPRLEVPGGDVEAVGGDQV